MNEAATKIQAKATAAAKLVNDCRTRVAEMATQPLRSSADIGQAVADMAKAEGANKLWARLNSVAAHCAANDKEFTEAILNEIVLELLAHGADDTWSGRSNDLARSTFDGLRDAADKATRVF